MDHLGKIGLSEEQADLIDVANDFCRDKSPISNVRALLSDKVGHTPALWDEIVSLGWMGVTIPEEQGGIGLGLAEAVPIVEAMGRHLLQTPFVSTTLAAQMLIEAGTPAQQATWLLRLASGTAATVAYAEPSNGWDLHTINCEATLNADGLMLSGRKRFVLDAESADLIVVTVQLDGKPTMVLLERSTLPSNALKRETVIDETKRSFALNLEGLTVPREATLDADKTDAALHHLHLAANLLSAAEMSGGNKSVIDYTVDYLKTRKQFGRLIGSYQALKHPVADAYCMYEQARSHLYSAAHSFTQQGTGEIATRMAKVSTLNAFSYASDRAIQFHGGFGFTYDCDAQLYRRRAIWHATQFGDAAYHKRKLADLMLG